MKQDNEKSKPPYNVVSFSGGKDSTAMLLRMIELDMPIDEILFCDTTVEFPALYEHIDKVEKYIGRKITRLRASHGFEYYLLKSEHTRTKNKNIAVMHGRSFPAPNQRWCTSTLKTHVINKHYTVLRKEYQVIEYIGIAADEPKRVKEKCYPLVEWGWTEADCLRYCYEKGFNWNGLYEIFNRVSCWCCPLQSLAELRKLRRYFPQLWDKLHYWQMVTWRSFRPDYTVQELEIRFRLEEEWEAKGLPTGRNKDFQKALADRLGRAGTE